MIKRIGTIIISSIYFILNLSANDTILYNYIKNIVKFNKELPQEKVYLHMDNRSYFIGDTIWFKAYVMNATTLHPTQMSGVFYVELLNEYGAEVAHKKLRLENGMCHGDFILKEDFRTGYYEIRAYTRYMLNFGNDLSAISYVGEIGSDLGGPMQVTLYPSTDIRATPDFMEHSSMSSSEFWSLNEDEQLKMRSQVVPDPNLYIFSRVFPVYAHPKIAGEYKKEMEVYPFHTKLRFPKETSIDLRPDTLKLSFYPEGGTLVEGLTSIVAFEAVDQWGKKCEVEGYVTDGTNTINAIKSISRGRGVFSFCPMEGQKYYAFITHKGKEYRFKLPKAESTGSVLHLTPPAIGKDMKFQIFCTPDMQHELLAWTLQCRGALTDYDTLTCSASTTFIVPKERLRIGVNQLTLFNTEGKVLADRLFFVCPPRETPTLTISHIPDSIQPYEAVNIDFQLQGKDGWFAPGHYSLSITDADEFEHDTYDTGDIRSELLLTSDIKGFIEDVDSYFRHASERTMITDIDLLMRIQGWRHHKWNREWRRYNWHMMAGVQPFEYKYAPEKGLGIDGYIISEDVTRKGNLMSPHTYDRIPNLKVKVSLNANGAVINKHTYADSTASYSIPFAPVFYGEVPMTITLEDTLKESRRKRGKNERLRNSQIIINRAFSPKPISYDYYQYKRPSEDLLADAMAYSGVFVAEHDINEVTIKKRFIQRSNIFYERPELVVDYMKEWNFILDRGTPWGNGRRIISTKHNSEYRMNFPSLTYSLQRLGATDWATIREDSIYNRYRDNAFYHAYIMPKTIKVYSNLLSRERDIMYNNQTIGELYYLDVERYKRSESPVHPPYLSRHGVRDTYYEGYSRSSEFYSPDYSECALPDTTDYRRTLYWNPNVWTDHQGRASVSFYNNKHTKKLHVRAEGFTRNGDFIVYDSDKPTN